MKYVLVTGAYGGMGKATVEALKGQGYTVFALDRRVEASTIAEIVPLEVDITNEESVTTAFEKVRAVTDHLDAIVHFAGIYLLDSFVEVSADTLQRAFEINVLGAMRINRIFLPLLSQGSKILITTSELAPLDPLPFTGIYAVTKAALDKYAYSLRMELQLLGIPVSVLRAGAVKTDMLGVSTTALDAFCKNTTLYTCNADRFKRVVDGVEARHIPTAKIAKKALKILLKKKPKFAYHINRNPLLLLLNILPKRMQLWAIKQVLR